MREHLKKFFTASAAYHLAMAKAHEGMMDAEEDGSDGHTFHKSAMTAHATMGEESVACCKACSKADAADGLEKITMEVSGIAPPPPSVRMVPRYGQQPLPTANENPIFAEVFGSELGSDE